MKKIFIFCAFCASAIMASAAGEVTLGTVYIDDEIAALDNIATALNDVEGVSATGTITYDVETNTLTLNEATVVVSLDKPVIRFSSWAEDVTDSGWKYVLVPVSAFGGAFGTAGYFVYGSIADMIKKGKHVQINKDEILHVILVDPIDVPVI